MARLQNHRKYLTVITIILIAGAFTLIWRELYKTPASKSDSFQTTRKGEQAIDLKSDKEGSTMKVKQGIASNSFKLTEGKSTDSGVFVFNEDMKSILEKLGKWYKMELVYKGAISNKTHFGTFSKSENITDILSFLQRQTGIKLTIENSKIIVEP